MTSREGCAFHEEGGLFVDEVDVLLADRWVELDHSGNGGGNRLLIVGQYSSILGRSFKNLMTEISNAIRYP